jgi:hypothetical protein
VNAPWRIPPKGTTQYRLDDDDLDDEEDEDEDEFDDEDEDDEDEEDEPETWQVGAARFR